MRTAFIALLAIGWVAGTTWSEAAAQTPSSQVAVSVPLKRGKARHAAAAETQGAAPKSANVEDPLASCLAIWDRATHMTRREWARACRRVAERLKDATMK